MSDTKPVGVRVPIELLDRAKAVDPAFNLSEFVRSALRTKYGSVEAQVDEFFKSLENDKK